MARGSLFGVGIRVLRDLAVHGDAADLPGFVFAEPEIAVAHHQRKRPAARREAVGKFRHLRRPA